MCSKALSLHFKCATGNWSELVGFWHGVMLDQGSPLGFVSPKSGGEKKSSLTESERNRPAYFYRHIPSYI